MSAAPRAQVCAVSQTQAAKLMNVSRRSVQHARVVLDRGTPELIAAVERGGMAVSLASEIARAPADVQHKAVAGGWAVAKAIARQVRQARRDERLAAEHLAWQVAKEGHP
jgi:hypothetical protein